MAEQKDAKKAVLYSSAPPDDIQKERLEKFIKYKFGTGFELTYIKDKNLFGVSISHCIIGVVTIFLGIID